MARTLAVVMTLLASACVRRDDPPATPPPEAPAVGGDAGAAALLPLRPRLRLTLRSTPPGAIATIDGRFVGTTPLRWELEADGRAHEFRFTLPAHAPWALRFPPVKDGVIHARLRPLAPAPRAGR